MTYAQALAHVRRHLKRFAGPGESVDVYDWPGGRRTRHGVRIAEVSFSTRTAGASYMQCDPEGLPICAAVERVMIAILSGAPKGDIAEKYYLLDWFLGHRDQRSSRAN